jgi:hypothetical protein
LSIKTVGDSRKKHLEEKGNDMIQARSDMDFGVMPSSIKLNSRKFSATRHNSKSNRWIELKLY